MKMIDPELRQTGRLYKPKFQRRSAIRAFNDRTRQEIAGKPGTDSLRYDEISLPRADGSMMRVCVYRPIGEYSDAVGLLWLHGGGFAYGVPENGAGFIELMSSQTPCVTYAPDYRLSCDAPYPAAIEDCYTALCDMVRHCGELGIDSSRIFVAGESAGGSLTAALCMMARDRGDVRIACQIPLYPMMDDRESESARRNNAPVWNARTNRRAWRMYLGRLYGCDDIPPYAVPGRADDHADLPPAIIYVGTVDPLRDDARAYARSLRDAGVPVDYREFEGGYHAFDMLCRGTKISDEALDFLRERFLNAAENYRNPQPEDQEKLCQ